MIFEALWPERRSARTSPSVHPGESGGPFWGGADTLSGVPFSVTGALANGSVLQANLLLGGLVGSLPRIVYQRTGRDQAERATGHHLWWILHDEPNPEMTAATFQFQQMVSKMNHGFSFAEIERWPTGRPRYLWPIPAELVTPRRAFKRLGGGVTYQSAEATPEDRRAGGVIVYQISGCVSGEQEFIDSRNAFHVPWMSTDGLKGRSPLQLAMETATLGRAIVQAAAAHFGNGALPGGWLERPADAEPLTPTGERNLLAAWNKHHGGTPNSGRVGILQEGTKFHPTSVPMQQSQLFEMLGYQPQLVSQIFNIPAHFLGHTGGSDTYANVESRMLELLQTSLLYHLEQDEQECYRKLVSDREGPVVYVEYETKQLLRGDIAARMAAYKVLSEIGVMSPNDIARAENLPAIPAGQGGDDYRPKVATPAPAPATGEPDPAEKMPAKMPSRAEVAARALLLAAVERAAAKEQGIVRKEAERSLATLVEWADGFYMRHAVELASIAPGAAAWAMEEAARHRRELREQAAADLWDIQTLGAMLARWAEETSDAADRLAAEVA